jgi:anti-sigma factor RsiW
MACEDMAPLLHASLDDELDAIHAARVEHHVADCPACAAELGRLRALRTAIRDHTTYHRLPASDRAAVLPRLRAADRAHPTARRSSSLRPAVSRRALGGMAASLLVGAVLGTWLGPQVLGLRSEADPSDGLIAAHVRGLQPGHAIDVVSSDQHTVKPWFDGRADFSPPVRDLGEQGFALIGGRLDYADHRTVAVIVYRRRQHQIDLFAWPLVPAADQRSPVGTVDGYHLRSWTQDGFRLVAVSDLNESELDEFVQRWRAS